MKIVLIFVDGLGIAPAADDNPVTAANCPYICKLLEGAKAIDACLGVDGLPQSATGQATLFCGRNASQFMKRHVEGFPGPALRKFIEEDNVFTALKARKRRSTFADGYLAESVMELNSRRFRSASTVAAATCPEVIRLRDAYEGNNAVAHDLTRERLIEKGFNCKPITPETAAEHLLEIAAQNDFTLFEFFITDEAGHSGQMEQAAAVLKRLDRFLATFVPAAENGGLLTIITSDHGNIENMSAHGHTRNPIPLIARGPKAAQLLTRAESLLDIEPFIVENAGQIDAI